MSIKQRLKQAIVQRSIGKRKKAHPFDQHFAENFTLPPDALPDKNNSYYFSAHDGEGASFLFRLGRRGGGKSEIWLAYKNAAGQAWINSRHLFDDADSPAKVECITPGEKWAFSYKGKAVKLALDKDMAGIPQAPEAHAEFTGTFTASDPIFEFSYHMDPEPLARAIAMEKWTKGFFKEVQENDQTHYEQQGHVKGELTLDGKKIPLDMRAMRDHSFGKRDWNYMDRHIWLMALLEDGTALNVNMVRYPAVANLQTGYYITDSDTVCVHSATPMDEIECTGKVPKGFQYSVRLTDGRVLQAACEKEMEFVFPFDEGLYTIYEGVGNFTVNGVKGRGIIEFAFNRDASRWTRGGK